MARITQILLFLSMFLFNVINALDQVGFLFKNQALCGNPFADAQWIPVLDLCEKECKPTEICVEDDELTQKCKKLPDECNAKFEQMKEREKKARARRVRKSKSVTLVNRTLHQN